MSLNVVTLVGRVGGEPELRYIDSGNGIAKCKMTLAVRRPTRNSDTPDWFNLELWGRTAEVARDYVRKGTLIAVKGALKFERWNDNKTGADRSSPIILVDRMDLLGSKRDTDPNLVNGQSDDVF